jgi:hypothetical protein
MPYGKRLSGKAVFQGIRGLKTGYLRKKAKKKGRPSGSCTELGRGLT